MHSNVKKIAMIGMLLAIQIILGRFVSITLPVVKLSFMFLPRALTALFFGPLWGAAAAVMGDFLVTILGPYAYFPPMATTALLEGIVYALFLYRTRVTVLRVFLAKLSTNVLNVFLGSLWSAILYGKGYLYRMPTSALKNTFMLPVQTVMLVLLFAALIPVLYQAGMMPRQAGGHLRLRWGKDPAGESAAT